MKKPRVLRLFAVVVAMLLILGLAACNTAAPSPTIAPTTAVPTVSATDTAVATSAPTAASLDKVSLVLGWQNATKNSADDKNWPSMFIDEMCKKLNIDLSIVGYNDDKLNLALAGGDLPDMMLVNNKYIPQIVQGGLAVALDGYLDQYGQNIKLNSVRNDILRKYFSNGTGKLYFHTPSSGLDNPLGGTELWNGYIVRWDLYKKIGAPVMKNDDDYIAALKAMIALNPKTETGDPVSAMAVFNDWGLWGWTMRSIANQGYANLSQWGYVQNSKTNEIVNNYLDYQTPSPFWNDMAFYWKLNQAGILDPDTFTAKYDDVSAKATKGQYVGGFCTWPLADYYATNQKADPATLKGFVAIPFEGSAGWYGSNWVAGWTDKDLFITNKCKNIERAVMFVDYQDSTECNRLFWSGKEGDNWTATGGKATVSAATQQLRSQGGDAWAKTGIADSSWSNIIGYSGSTTDPTDGQAYDLYAADRSIVKAALNPLQKDFSAFYKVDVPTDVIANMVKAGTATDKSKELPNISACMDTEPDDIVAIDSKCTDIVTRAIPTIVLAKDQASFEAARNQLIADLKAAGTDTAWTWWQTQWNAGKDYISGLVSK